MKYLITTLSALAIATSFALAEDATPPAKAPGAGEHKHMTPEEIFKKLDANGDGTVSLDEYKAGPMGKKDPAKAEEKFKKMDTDSDGKLTLEEFKAGHTPHAPGAGAPGKGPGHGPGKGGHKDAKPAQ